MAWGWVIFQQILISVWTIPLMLIGLKKKYVLFYYKMLVNIPKHSEFDLFMGFVIVDIFLIKKRIK